MYGCMVEIDVCMWMVGWVDRGWIAQRNECADREKVICILAIFRFSWMPHTQTHLHTHTHTSPGCVFSILVLFFSPSNKTPQKADQT